MNEERLKKFQQLGIPVPTSTEEVSFQAVKNKDMLLKLEQIKRGAKKNDFKEIIQKTEGIVLNETPVNNQSYNNNNQKKGFQTKNNVPLQSFAPATSNSEALAMERMLYGDDNSFSQNQYINESSDNYPVTDYRQKLEERLSKKMSSNETNPYLKNSLSAKNASLQEEQIVEMVSELSKKIAAETAKETVKKIILEFAKSGKEILVESTKIKKAEIVAKDKVKIDGKIYKLVELKS
jgi:hypothetical protein